MSKWQANSDHLFLQLPDRTLHTYNAHDAHEAGKLLLALITELRSPRFPPGHERWFHDVIQPLQGAVMAMQRRGFAVDLGARRSFTAATSRELAETDNAIRREAAKQGFPYTDKFPNSDKQVAELLHNPNYCGLRSRKSTDSGRSSVDQDALLRILRQLRKKDEPYRQLLLDLCHRSRLQTVLERYTTFGVDEDGRVRATVKMAAVKSYRFAYAGPALQQFPPETRGYFVASPGRILVASDFKQLEPQWLALLASDEPMLKVFRSGGDIHKSNVLELFNLGEAEWETWPSDRRKSYRNYAKSNFLYKIVYGGEGSDSGRTYCPCSRCVDKVPQVAEFKRPERLAAEQRWFAAHPDVRRFQRDLVSEVRSRGYYASPFGVRRYLARTWGSNAEREIKNIPEQMNAALLMNRCQVELHRRSAPIILQHHDSFILEVPESPGRLVDQWEADLRGVMEEPVPEVDGYSFPVETSKGYRWSDL